MQHLLVKTPPPAGYLLSLAPSAYPSHPGVKTPSTQPPSPTKNTITPPLVRPKTSQFRRPEPHFQNPGKIPMSIIQHNDTHLP